MAELGPVHAHRVLAPAQKAVSFERALSFPQYLELTSCDLACKGLRAMASTSDTHCVTDRPLRVVTH